MISASIKLISLNIERSKHLDRVLPFLGREKPDVVCLQELCERDISRFEEIMGPCRSYGPIVVHPADPPEEGTVVVGTALFARSPVRNVDAVYYRGSEEHARTAPPKRIMEDIVLVGSDIEHDDASFRIITTHFTWSSHGQAIDQQRIDMKALLSILGHRGEFILTGDLNAPRGGEIFSILAEKYKDNVPKEYTTSIDINFHYAAITDPVGLSAKMVDGLFTTNTYTASDVRLQFGVSDHAAIVATISKAA